ncbi:MAG TPA: hypothetical protein VK540_17740 [Polyangiaceae bacterium]|nr:hypothetical protein [Polyangiaceae bacterium]
MRRTLLSLGRLFSLVIAAGSLGAMSMLACSADSGSVPSGTRGSGGSTSSGGSAGTGAGGSGNAGTGGGTGSGGSTGTGGTMGSGGTTGSGGATTGGSAGAGGTVGTGGSAGSGGSAGTAGKGGAAGAGGSAGTSGTGGASGSGGGAGSGTGGSAGKDGGADAGGSAGSGGGTTDAGGATCMPGDGGTARFSFFLASLVSMREQSGSQDGFGGDLSLGKTDSMGAKDGLAGADEICRRIADKAFPGAGCKQWRAFLSVTKGPNGGGPINAIDRVGPGPWYDRLGRIVAMTKTALAMTRPQGMDPAIINDFPNEHGTPNHNPDGTGAVDNHDILTGSNATGLLNGTNWTTTCHDWTSKVGSDGRPRVGHSWPAGSGMNWMSALDEAGCAAGVNLVEMGPPNPLTPTVGSGGGYGGIYCFALTP